MSIIIRKIIKYLSCVQLNVGSDTIYASFNSPIISSNEVKYSSIIMSLIANNKGRLKTDKKSIVS